MICALYYMCIMLPIFLKTSFKGKSCYYSKSTNLDPDLPSMTNSKN